MLGLLSLIAAWQAPALFWAWVILLGVFVVDATVTLFRHVLRPYEAHRSHAYQYASRRLGAHRPVSLAVGAVNVLWLFPWALAVTLGWVDGALAVSWRMRRWWPRLSGSKPARLNCREAEMSAPRVLIVGAGGHGRSVAEALEALGGVDLAGFVDDGWPALAATWSYPVLGTTADFVAMRAHATHAVVAIGNNDARAALTRCLRATGFQMMTVIHPRAVVSPRAVVGDGSTIMAGAVVGTEAVLGEGVIVNSGAVVDHHARVDAFGHLGVGACMAGGTVLGERAWLWAGVAVGYGGRVGVGEVVRG